MRFRVRHLALPLFLALSRPSLAFFPSTSLSSHLFQRCSGFSRNSAQREQQKRRVGMAAEQPLDDEIILAAARDYVDKSNRGEVTACLAMFAQNAVYGSTTVGGHEGIDAITTMMDGFFGKFPTVNWQVEDYVVSKDHPNCIEFLFTRTGVTNAECKNTRQHGKEWVCFTSAGASKIAISRVIVETFKTEILDDS